MNNTYVLKRKDYTALSKYLCEKLEFIVKVRLTPLQIQLYRLYLDTQTNRGSNPYAVSIGYLVVETLKFFELVDEQLIVVFRKSQ